MKAISFNEFVNEQSKPKKTPKVSAPEPVDTSKGIMRKFKIDEKEYEGVLTTYEALRSKQESMGYKEVGMISLPGEKEVYELLKENNKDNDE